MGRHRAERVELVPHLRVGQAGQHAHDLLALGARVRERLRLELECPREPDHQEGEERHHRPRGEQEDHV